jgi:hypothetical protein
MTVDLDRTTPDSAMEPDPVAGFAYCREVPPDVPPGMTLDEWRHARHPAHRHRHLWAPARRPRRPHCLGLSRLHLRYRRRPA